MTTFHKNDRAYCIDAGLTALHAKQLYYVQETYEYLNGEQALRLTGLGDDWYNAARFVRIADPAARKAAE